MSEANDQHAPDADDELPAGIAEDHERRIPLVLKLTYIGFTVYAILYFFLYRTGDGSMLVQLLNQATGH